MTPTEQKLARALVRCRLPPASFTKRLARNVAAQAEQPEPQITEKQLEWVFKLVRKFRRQIRADSIEEEHLFLLDKSLPLPISPVVEQADTAAPDPGHAAPECERVQVRVLPGQLPLLERASGLGTTIDRSSRSSAPRAATSSSSTASRSSSSQLRSSPSSSLDGPREERSVGERAPTACYCSDPSSHVAKGLCPPCYQRQRRQEMPPASCHPNRKEHCGGLCRPCYRAGGRAARATCHPERLQAAKGLCSECYTALPANKARKIRLRRLKKYKLSAEEYDALLAQQSGLCAICRTAEPTAVDHDHATGRVRGLLCLKCNAAIGLVGDSPSVLRNAISYLEVRCLPKAA